MENYVPTANKQQTRRCKLEDRAQNSSHRPVFKQDGGVRHIILSPIWRYPHLSAHAIFNCPTVHIFWNQTQTYGDKITDQNLVLTPQKNALLKGQNKEWFCSTEINRFS